MFHTFPIQSLSQLPEPVLSVYLDTNPAQQNNLPAAHGYLSCFKNEARNLLANLTGTEADLLRPQLQKIEQFLLRQPQQQPGLALFAGHSVWEVIPLSLQPLNQLHWGKPMLWQLFTLADHHPPACIAFVDGAGAQLLSSRPGQVVPLETIAFQPETSQWRRMESSHATERGIGLPHGPQRDLFERRRKSLYLRFLTGIAQKIAELCETHSLTRVYLLGATRSARAVQRRLPEALRSMSLCIPHTRGEAALSESLAAIDQPGRQFELARKEKLVEDLLNRASGAVTGTDETLAELQRGRLASLLLVEDFNPSLRFCSTCSHATASPLPECPICQGDQSTLTLHEILPQLAASWSCRVELLQDKAANLLRPAGSIGGYLRTRQATPHPQTAAAAA